MELHFADFRELKKKGMEFDCATCPASVQKARKCHDDNWDNELKGSVFPILLMPQGHQHTFCPAKLERDDPEFCSDANALFLSWKLGQVPSGGSVDTMDEDQLDMMLTLIRKWESYQRVADFKTLARILGGDSSAKDEKNGDKARGKHSARR